MSLTITPQFQEILEKLENGTGHLFITGKAGTGKSTLLQYFRAQTHIPVVVLAPTGVAAVNVGGETIHSFFQFSPGVTPREARSDAFMTEEKSLYKKLRMIIIDEISMVRSDLLDCIDVFLRVVRDDDRAFGGVRMIFFGDLYQLPPVVTSSERMTFRSLYPSEWFFDAKVMQYLLSDDTESFEMIELDTIYRQTDTHFIQLLGHIRMRTITEGHLTEVNTRVERDGSLDPSAITVTGRRDTAAAINQEHLQLLQTKEHFFDAQISGQFPDGHLPTSTQLSLKVGARVMFVANDPQDRFVNGTLGSVKRIFDDAAIIAIDGKGEERIEAHTWELSHTVLTDSGELEKKKVGEFTQLPLMLAWAVTIHKSQGKTFDRIVIDLESGAFAHGQVYVALSRATTFEGITLKHPLKESDIKLNWRIVQFLTAYKLKDSHLIQSREEKYQRIEDAIEMGTQVTLSYLKDVSETREYTLIPEVVQEMIHNGQPFIGLVGRTTDGGELTLNAEKILHVG